MKTVKRSLLFAILIYSIGCAQLRQGEVYKQNVIQSEAIQEDYPSFEIQPLDDEAKIYKTLNGVYISQDVVHFDDEKETQNVEQIQLKSETHETNQQFIVYEDPINWNDQGTQEIQDAQVYEDKTNQIPEQDDQDQEYQSQIQEQNQQSNQNIQQNDKYDEQINQQQLDDEQQIQLIPSDMELQPNDNKITIELPNNIINDKTIKLQAKLEVTNDISQIKDLLTQQTDLPLIKQIIQQNSQDVEFDDDLFDEKPIIATKIIAEYTLTQFDKDEEQQLNQQEGEEQEPEQEPEQAPDEAEAEKDQVEEDEEKPVQKKKKKKKKKSKTSPAANEDDQGQEDGEQQVPKKKKKKKKKKPQQAPKDEDEPQEDGPKDEDQPKDDDGQVDKNEGGECKVIKHEHHHYHHYDKKKEEEKAEREAEGGEEKGEENEDKGEKEEEKNEDGEKNDEEEGDKEDKSCKPKGKKGAKGKKDKADKRKKGKKSKKDDEEDGEKGEDAEGDDQEDWSKEKKKKLKQKQPIYDEYGRYIRNHPYINQKDHYRYYPYYRYNDYHKFRPDYYYRHRWTYPDHYPFHHTHPYHKFHPYDQYDCHQCPESLGKFYPDLTGQGKIAQAYKGRYTNPEQVLKDIVTRRRQNQFYRQYMQPERISTGYFHNMGQANIQKDLQDCFTVYNECGYKGKSLTLCGEQPDIKNSFQIFSYQIPNDLTVKFFKSQNEAIDVEGSNECLEIPYELI
ncbi:hypothetical protein pb186bvf_018041 [Paramecium bursaria]